MDLKTLSHPAWQGVAGLVAIVGIGLGVLTYCGAQKAEPGISATQTGNCVNIGSGNSVNCSVQTTGSLSVSEFDVRDPIGLSAVSYEGAERSLSREEHPWTVNSNTIDVSLNNTSDDTHQLTEIRVRVKYVKEVPNCTGSGGSGYATAQYTVPLPLDPTTGKVKTEVAKKIDFRILPHRVDRLLVTVGPEVVSISSNTPTVYLVDLDTRYDGDKWMSLGSAAFSILPGNLTKIIESNSEMGDLVPDCLNPIKDALAPALEAQSAKSPELQNATSLIADKLDKFNKTHSATPAASSR